MGEQLNLLTGEPDDPTAPHNHTDTSKAAAQMIRPAVKAQRLKVFRAIRDNQPVARFELSAITGLGGDSVRPRCLELIEMGIVVECNGTHGTLIETHTTPKGRQAFCLRIKEGTRWNDVT